jgi:ribosomal protein S18 acetylase RimI-like enzyme
MTVISLRPATRADDEFCYQLHKAAMGGYVAAVWGWDEQVQREYHARAFKPRRWQIITANGADAGMLLVEYRPDEVYLARIEIRPGLQGQGIGTRIINALLAEARQRGQDLVLDVLVVNERARALYERLGLTEVAPVSDGDVRVSMRSASRDAVAG